HLDQVVPGLRLDLGRILGLLGAHVRDVIDLELDAGVLREPLPDLRQLFVGRGREVVPAEVRDLTLLSPGRRDARSEDAGAAGGGREDASVIHGVRGVFLLKRGCTVGGSSRGMTSLERGLSRGGSLEVTKLSESTVRPGECQALL